MFFVVFYDLFECMTMFVDGIFDALIVHQNLVLCYWLVLSIHQFLFELLDILEMLEMLVLYFPLLHGNSILGFAYAGLLITMLWFPDLVLRVLVFGLFYR